MKKHQQNSIVWQKRDELVTNVTKTLSQAALYVDTAPDLDQMLVKAIGSVETLAALPEPSGNLIVPGTNIMYRELLGLQAVDKRLQTESLHII